MKCSVIADNEDVDVLKMLVKKAGLHDLKPRFFIIMSDSEESIKRYVYKLPDT